VRLLLVRHAESQGNREHRLQGRREFPLTERGIQQAQALASRLATTPIAAIYASPISRALHTAEVIAERAGIEVIQEPRVQEYDFGEALSGLTWQEIREKTPHLVTALRTDKSEFPHYPGEEGRGEFRDRVCAALREISSRHHRDEAVLVATHAGPIVVFLLETLGRTYSRPIPFTIDNASITTVEFNHNSARGVPEMVVTGLNDTCHLAHLQAKVWQET
jgi:broad specificity phosphatase PhoE